MKLTTYISLFFLVLTANFYAQVNMPAEFDTVNPYGQQLIVNGQFHVETSAMKNEMLDILAFGGFIDDNMKDRSFNRHKAINFVGLASNNDITYFHNSESFLKHSNWSWGVKAGYYAIGSVSYGKDVFGLVFYGNQSYLGDTAHFASTRVNYTLFQKVGFGVRDKKMGSYVFLNLVNVQDAVRGTIRKGDLYQDADGANVTMRLGGDVNYTSGNNFSKGLGLCIDAAYRIRVPWLKGKETVFEISASNLGFVYASNNVTGYSLKDSTYNYSGFRLKELFSDYSPFSRSSFSVLDSMGIAKTTGRSRGYMLPGFIQFGKLVDFTGSKKWQSYFGIRLYPSLDALPQAYAGAVYKPAKFLMLSANASYGGFGVLTMGFNISYIANQFRISLGSDNMIGNVYSGGYGKSLALRGVWNLKN